MSELKRFKTLPSDSPGLQEMIKEVAGPISTEEEKILEDPSVSYWLKQQIISSKQRDVCDSIKDAEELVLILRKRFQSSVDIGLREDDK